MHHLHHLSENMSFDFRGVRGLFKIRIVPKYLKQITIDKHYLALILPPSFFSTYLIYLNIPELISEGSHCWFSLITLFSCMKTKFLYDLNTFRLTLHEKQNQHIDNQTYSLKNENDFFN
jgi:hypothetical protein